MLDDDDGMTMLMTWHDIVSCRDDDGDGMMRVIIVS